MTIIHCDICQKEIKAKPSLRFKGTLHQVDSLGPGGSTRTMTIPFAFNISVDTAGVKVDVCQDCLIAAIKAAFQ